MLRNPKNKSNTKNRVWRQRGFMERGNMPPTSTRSPAPAW